MEIKIQAIILLIGFLSIGWSIGGMITGEVNALDKILLGAGLILVSYGWIRIQD